MTKAEIINFIERTKKDLWEEMAVVRLICSETVYVGSFSNCYKILSLGEHTDLMEKNQWFFWVNAEQGKDYRVLIDGEDVVRIEIMENLDQAG